MNSFSWMTSFCTIIHVHVFYEKHDLISWHVMNPRRWTHCYMNYWLHQVTKLWWYCQWRSLLQKHFRMLGCQGILNTCKAYLLSRVSSSVGHWLSLYFFGVVDISREKDEKKVLRNYSSRCTIELTKYLFWNSIHSTLTYCWQLTRWFNLKPWASGRMNLRPLHSPRRGWANTCVYHPQILYCTICIPPADMPYKLMNFQCANDSVLMANGCILLTQNNSSSGFPLFSHQYQ